MAFVLTDGTLSERPVTVTPDDDLADITGRSNYDGYVVDEIRHDRVIFENGEETLLGEDDSQARESVWRDQLAHTLRVHFERQADLDERGLDVKVLSLFFVEHVADYIGADAVLPRLFAEEYARLREKFPAYTEVDPAAVRGAYFSQTAKGKFQDEPKTDEEQRRAVDLILRKKAELLSKTEPISFIFSHTALGEGWDNPNVFQVCFLRHSRSDIQRRQQVGRGLRLPVNQVLERVFDKDVNRLTLIVNESYEDFVAGLNAQYVSPAGDGQPGGGNRNRSRGTPPPVDNDADKVRVEAKPGKRDSDEFKQLWSRIRYKTRYHVELDREALLAGLASADWDALDAIGASRNVVAEAELTPTDGSGFAAGKGRALRGVASSRAALPDLVGLIESALHDREPGLTLTRGTIAAALRAVPAQSHRTSVLAPEQWAAVLAAQVRSTAADIMVNHIRYALRPEAEWWEADLILRPAYDAYSSPTDEHRGVIPTPSDNSPNYYTHADYDSPSEKAFAEFLEAAGDKVRLYVRLPRTFDVPTPVGTFSPDYAAVAVRADSSEVVYLVQEIKSALLEGERRQVENQKIRFARRHFSAAPERVEFAVTTGARGLRFEDGDDTDGDD